MLRAHAKIYPEEVVIPIWKQIELARDPNFKDFHEKIAGITKRKGHWSYPRGYALTIREEARLLKAHWKAHHCEHKKISTQQTDSQHVVQSCGCFGR
jgi:hypothetical protein